MTVSEKDIMRFKDDNHCPDDDSIDSGDEALCEVLGLTSLEGVTEAEDDDEPGTIRLDSFSFHRLQNELLAISITPELQIAFKTDSMCILPKSLSVSAATMRRLTDELVWRQDAQVDKTYETVKIMKIDDKEHTVQERKTLTRLENFVSHHKEWNLLCNHYLKDSVSALCGQEMLLYKEKLNLKPPGGSGFAPHLDTPSLRVALGCNGPQTFVTIMVAIDNMTHKNGCLRICKGEWSEDNHCPLVPPSDDNPDAGGRQGAIPLDVADELEFQDVCCSGGDIVVFNGFAPHRSAANTSPLPRRAVFLTYNPASEGDFHELYYQRMEELRNEWRQSVGMAQRRQLTEDEQFELDALATVPK